MVEFLGRDRFMHLVISHDQGLECIYVSNHLELLAVRLHKMLNNHLDVLAFNEFEQFQAGRVEKVVSRHSVEKNLQDRFEQLVLNNLTVVRFIVEPNDGAEVFESS